jgi:hypothetical protein
VDKRNGRWVDIETWGTCRRCRVTFARGKHNDWGEDFKRAFGKVLVVCWLENGVYRTWGGPGMQQWAASRIAPIGVCLLQTQTFGVNQAKPSQRAWPRNEIHPEPNHRETLPSPLIHPVVTP